MTHTPTLPPPAPPRSDGMAITGFVCGCVGIFMFWLYGILPLLAVIFSGVSISRSRKTNTKPSGLAVAGLVLGIIELALIVLLIFALIADA